MRQTSSHHNWAANTPISLLVPSRTIWSDGINSSTMNPMQATKGATSSSDEARLAEGMVHRRIKMWPTWLRQLVLGMAQRESPAMPWQEKPESAQTGTHEGILRAFAHMPVKSVFDHPGTGAHGISEIEAATRRHIQGHNLLSSQKPPSWFMLLLLVIPNPFNILLIFLAIINAALPSPNWKGFVVLIVMVVISCIVRFWQEYRSGMAIFRLQASITSNFKVRRQPSNSKVTDKQHSPTEMNVSGIDLVPGDVVLLAPGAIVPADCLILESSSLRISQSTWTGESEPAPKVANFDGNKDEFSLFDLGNLAFMGTNIVSGTGVGLVLRTGDGKWKEAGHASG
ncbi:hypothetical protein ACJZ2D_006262 [Fusarium nematophilum]